jgi:hypothetical protein
MPSFVWGFELETFSYIIWSVARPCRRPGACPAPFRASETTEDRIGDLRRFLLKEQESRTYGLTIPCSELRTGNGFPAKQDGIRRCDVTLKWSE